MFEEGDCEASGHPSEEGMVRAEERWNLVMEKMIAGFEAASRISDGLYEKELGSYPMDRPSGVSAQAWGKIRETRRLASYELIKRDEALFEEGMALLATHWRSLWD